MLVIGPMELLVAQLEKPYCHPEEAWKKKAGENQQRIGQSQLSAGEDDERSRSERCRRAAQQTESQGQQGAKSEERHEHRLGNQIEGLAARAVAEPREPLIERQQPDDDQGQGNGRYLQRVDQPVRNVDVASFWMIAMHEYQPAETKPALTG